MNPDLPLCPSCKKHMSYARYVNEYEVLRYRGLKPICCENPDCEDKPFYWFLDSSPEGLIIPKSFELLGSKIEVKLDSNVFHDSDHHGWAKYRQMAIVLQKPTEGIKITEDFLYHTFIHELVHMILYFAGDEEFDPPLHQREYFVDRLAGLIHQFLKTARY